MEILSSLFVGKPLNILAVAILFLFVYLVYRFRMSSSGHYNNALLVAVVAWVLYAVWEYLVQFWTPEANIRVDLLIIWVILSILLVWAIYKSLR